MCLAAYSNNYGGGYSTTNYSAQGGADGGGFMNGSQGGSQDTPGGSKVSYLLKTVNMILIFIGVWQR
jgi:hypothetical protein